MNLFPDSAKSGNQTQMDKNRQNSSLYNQMQSKKSSSSKEYLPVNSERITYPDQSRSATIDELIIDINDLNDAQARACATNPKNTPMITKVKSQVQIDENMR